MTVRLQVVWPFQSARCTLDVSDVKVGASSRRNRIEARCERWSAEGCLAPVHCAQECASVSGKSFSSLVI